MMISSICHIMSQQNIRRWRYQTGLHSFRLSQHLQCMKTARRTEAFLELDEDKKEQLDEKMHVLQEYFSEKPEIMVTYFVPDEKKAGGAYVTHRGRIRKIDTYLRRLLFEDGTEVHMQYIFEMDGEIFGDTE